MLTVYQLEHAVPDSDVSVAPLWKTCGESGIVRAQLHERKDFAMGDKSPKNNSKANKQKQAKKAAAKASKNQAKK
jgi:hypothetical protein